MVKSHLHGSICSGVSKASGYSSYRCTRQVGFSVGNSGIPFMTNVCVVYGTSPRTVCFLLNENKVCFCNQSCDIQH